MILDLRKFFMDEGESLPFAYKLDLSSVELGGVKPFVSLVEVKGLVEDRSGCAELEAEVSFAFSIPCDRCARQIDSKYQYHFSHTLVRSLNQEEDSDAYIQVDNGSLDLDELLRADILLELPTKYLCREDCKGLCAVCGKNLNDGPCNCNLHQIDPRLEVLKQLID